MKTKTNHPQTARSLATTLAIAFFTLSVVILLVNGGFALYTNVRVYQEGVAVQQQLIAADASKAVSTFIQEKFNTLETAVDFADPVKASAEERKTFIDGLLGSHPSFQQFILLSKQGRSVADTSGIGGTVSEQFASYREDALEQTSSGSNYISPVYIDDATSEPLIAIAIPVKNVLGDTEGSLMAEVNLKFMWSLVDQLTVGETGYAYVVDNQGSLIAFQDTTRVLAGENASQVSEVGEFVENSDRLTDITPEVVSYTGLTGTTVVGTYVPLSTPNWAVVIEQPTAEAYAPIYQSAAASVATILLMAILAGIAGVAISRRLSVPLVDLTGTATRIANGEIQLKAATGGAQEIVTLAAAFNTMTERLRDLISTLEQRVADRTKALETSTEVSRRLSTILDRKELVAEVVNQVRNAFGYYHTQIYFYDEARENLVMAGGTGEAGKLMLEQFHKLAKGRGLVGRAAENNKPILVADTSQNPEWLPNPLLPETKSEAVIPISIGDLVLGALDVQHNIVDGLKSEDINALQSIANQVAIAAQNAQSYTEIQRSQALLSDALKAARLGNWEYDFENDLFHFSDEFYAIFRTSAEKVGGYKISSADYAKHFVHPDDAPLVGTEIQKVLDATDRHFTTHLEHRIIFSDGEVGYIAVNINVERDGNGKITRWYGANQDITERRSLEEINRKRAAQQEAINLITQKIQSAGSIETAMKVAARELGHALGGKPTLVTLEPSALAGDSK